jgi:hypothetical protein
MTAFAMIHTLTYSVSSCEVPTVYQVWRSKLQSLEAHTLVRKDRPYSYKRKYFQTIISDNEWEKPLAPQSWVRPLLLGKAQKLKQSKK